MTVLRFVVPGEPRPKQRPRHGNGFTYTPLDTVQAERKIKAHARQAKVRPLSGPVALEVRFFRATKRRCDLDNLTKLVQDALNGIAYRDDSQIKHLLATVDVDAERPRTEVTVQPHPAMLEQGWDHTPGGGADAAVEDGERFEAEFLRRCKGDQPA